MFYLNKKSECSLFFCCVITSENLMNLSLFSSTCNFDYNVYKITRMFLYYFNYFEMRLVLIIAMIILWCIFVACVLMMSPKWWLWLWIGWASASWNEYWSKKSIEWKLKIIAMITWILFVWVCLFLPFVG